MGSRERLGEQQLDASRFQDAGNKSGRSENGEKHPPGIEEGRDSSIDTAHQPVDIGIRARFAAKQRDRGGGAGDDVDPQQKEEEDNEQRGKPEQNPEDFSRQRFPKGVADQGQGDHYFCTVRTKTSSRVLVVGARASISQCSARSRSTAPFTSSRLGN